MAKSPRITGLSWGSVEIGGKRKLRDAKLYPGGAREWNWDETGTAHAPGILPADVEELIARGAKVVVLSQGMLSCLRVTMDTLDLLARKGVRAHILKTEDAVQRYNELRETEPVGALIHTTC
ncbi:MAG: Mth938-like domain-containing protein [Candidatus Krumholzibacteria bacterium]|nr:Mth938-like domain-containing protein [Candidatus Krumholzibacteria bacterium]